MSLVSFRGHLLRAMVEAGHEVRALAPDSNAGVIEALERMGVSFRTVPMASTGTNPLADLRTVASIVTCLRRMRPDVFLSYTMKPIIYGGIAARLARVPSRYAMITGLGYVYSAVAERNMRLRFLRWISGILYRRALYGTKILFVYNPDDEEEVARRSISRGVKRVIRIAGSGVDLNYYAMTRLPPGPPIFLMIARLLREKGVDDYVQAARLLKANYPEIRVRLLGPFYPHPTAISPAQIESWVREGVVDYLGETDDVRPYLADCTVFVLPSYYREGIPRAVLEAMSTGRAIITTDSPGCRETVLPEENGLLVPVRDPIALASAMERFVRDLTLAERMGQRARELAVERYDVQSINRVLLQCMSLIATTSTDSRGNDAE